MHSEWRRIGSLVAAAVFAVTACGGDDDSAADAAESVAVADAWSRQPASGQVVTAVYAVVTNTSDDDLTITGASSPLTDRVELHETLAGDDGMMSMREAPDGFVVPAGGSFVFESGGPHVMLFDIDADTYPTDVVSVTFEFDDASTLTVDAEVRAIEGGAMGDMEDDHDMSGDMDG